MDEQNPDNCTVKLSEKCPVVVNEEKWENKQLQDPVLKRRCIVWTHIGSDQAWDLEDLFKAGKKVKCCPCYAVRELKNAVQIIICPCN